MVESPARRRGFDPASESRTPPGRSSDARRKAGNRASAPAVADLPELEVKGGARDPQRLRRSGAAIPQEAKRIQDRLALHLGQRTHAAGGDRAGVLQAQDRALADVRG